MEKVILNTYHIRYFFDICLDEVNRDGGCLSIKDTRIVMRNLPRKFYKEAIQEQMDA
jgi:hypothetical protein